MAYEIEIQITRDLHAWCEDTFSDMPVNATDHEVRSCVERNYVGGLVQFIEDGSYYA